MNPSDDHAQRALDLFDILVEMEAPARTAWLAELEREDRPLAEELGRMLAADARTSGVLDGELAALAPGTLPPDPIAVVDQGAPRQRIGAFELIRPLGQGGMGEVWLAEREEAGFRQQVALKLLRRGLDSADSLRRFVQERRILAELSHPAIARFIDGGVSEAGVSWYAMEYVDGVPVTEYARLHGLDVRACVGLVLQVAAAVAYAQNRLIVHRDLKPSNILVDAEGRPHLLDFGIAKLLAQTAPADETASGLRAMSPAYAAPEQVLDQPISTATDVYALGVVLYELLTGVLPHQRAGSTLEKLADQVRQEITERPSARVRRDLKSDSTTRDPGASQRLARAIGPELDLIVLTALRREPERRYPNAAAFGDDLKRWLDGRPISAQPDTTRYRMRKFVARHRLAVVSSAAIVLALVGGISAALWQARIARAQAERAEAQLHRAEALKDFSLSLFREQDPFARGKPAPRTAAELIALGVERARSRFADDVGQRTELLNDLGEIQTSLGELEAGRAVLEQVVKETAAAFGERSVQHAAAQSNLASTLMALGDFPTALALLDRHAPVLEELAGHDAPITLKALGRRVHAMSVGGRLKESLPLALDLLPRFERVYGRDSTETLIQLADLGSIQDNLDQIDAAEATARDVVIRTERLLGPDHLQLARPLGRLGDILKRRDKLDEADAFYARAVTLARKQGQGVLLGALLLRRGDLLRRAGRYDEAAQHFDESATLLPPGSGELAQVEMFRGGLLRARGDLLGAEQAYLRSYKVFLAAVGPDSPFPWHSAVHYAETAGLAGHGAEAEPLLLEAAANLRRIAAPDSYDVMVAAAEVATWRALQGRHGEALPLWREAIAVGTKVYGADQIEVLEVRVQLAESLVALGDAQSRDEAKAVLAALPSGDALPEKLRGRTSALSARLD